MKGNFGLIIFGVIAIVMSIVLFGVAAAQLDTAMSATEPVQEDTFTLVETPSANVSANVTLSDDLWEGLVTRVISISSNISETPVAGTYYSTPKVLQVDSLDASENRTLIVSFYKSAPVFSSLVDVMGVYGILFWVAITGAGLAMLGFGVVGTVRSARGRR